MRTGNTRSLVKSELDLHVDMGRGMEGCGRGGLSVVAICWGRACEFTVCGSFVDGIRCQLHCRVNSRSGIQGEGVDSRR
jgi:hypothetical protein